MKDFFFYFNCGVDDSFLDNFGNRFTATMLEPVSIADGENCDHRNRQENPGNSRQFCAGKNREDYRQRVQMNSHADDARIDDVVLNNSQDAKKNSFASSG